MTPNELKDYVDAAVRQRESISILLYILVPVISVVGSALVAYLTEKGKNTATKEDVGRITTEIESSKAHFTERLEHVRADLSSRSHYSKVRYERELKVFEEVWPKLCHLREAILSLRPVLDSLPASGQTEDSRKRERYGKVVQTFKELDRTVQQSRPFYPPKIWHELRKLLDLCYREAIEFETFNFCTPGAPPWSKEYWEKAITNSVAINEQVDKTCEMIRSRLTGFEDA